MIELGPYAGGLIVLRYWYSDPELSHPIHLAVAPFDRTPVGPDGDYRYTGTGLTTPTEPGLLATSSAVQALWTPYYNSDWYIQLDEVWWNNDGMCELLPLPRGTPPVQGTRERTTANYSVLRRMLKLYEDRERSHDWTIYLQQIFDDRYGKTLEVSPTGGGYDERDRAVYAYLSGPDTGVVGRNGKAIRPGGTVRQWADAPLPKTDQQRNDDGLWE